ncbi:transposase, partial [Acetobacter sp. DsW_063]|uniref:transposase n=1 Tax=Acetobacter sp. DsW_063 TaxID=1514894 RepID=UPI003512793E
GVCSWQGQLSCRAIYKPRVNVTAPSPGLLAAASKARWVYEQAHQQLKEELGFDHFERRSRTGLHRHTLMSMMAYAYVTAGGRKNESPGHHHRRVC